MRVGLRCILEQESDIDVVGEATAGEQIMALTHSLSPEVIVVHMTLVGPTDETLLQGLRESEPRVPLLFLGDINAYALSPAIRVAGHLPIDTPRAEVAAAVRFVAGSSYRGESVEALGHASQQQSHPDPCSLSAREREVLGFIASGYTNAQIAENLMISPRTVESHRLHIRQKLRANSRAELVRLGRQLNLLWD